MKTGFIKLLPVIAVSLSPMLASAQMAYDVATFKTDESVSDQGSPATTLRSSQFLKGDLTAPNAAYTPYSGPRTVADTSIDENEMTASPEMADPEPAQETTYDSYGSTSEPEPAYSYSNHTPEPVAEPIAEPAAAPMPEPAPIAMPAPAPAPVSHEAPQTSSYDSYSSAPVAPSNMRPGLDSQSHWQIRNGERLSDVVARWAASIGWQTSWEPEDLVALADLELDDNFTGAITKVVDALNRSGANVQAQFYAANRMLRIMARK